MSSCLKLGARSLSRCLRCSRCCLPWQRRAGRGVLSGDGDGTEDGDELAEVMLPRSGGSEAEAPQLPAGRERSHSSRSLGSAERGDSLSSSDNRDGARGGYAGGNSAVNHLVNTATAASASGRARGARTSRRARWTDESGAPSNTPAAGDPWEAVPPSNGRQSSRGRRRAAAAGGAPQQAGVPWTPEEVVQAVNQAMANAQQQAQQQAEAAADAYTSTDAAILMSLLPHERWKFSYIRDADCGEGDGECRVCLADYEADEEIVRLPCMHYAHTQCMEQWLARQPRCPVCRTNVREVLEMGMGDFELS
eukprot:TRINITY_DN47548_c0_g1_i1.p1 TRINITY_DN47548_c0_g1~~TRINITY_DN47548_c0_g1_i1.p1  ORF type:complete len:307 (-),score=61.32 TRINITY_DN47548_c0_g1_i1:81-1001(-)